MPIIDRNPQQVLVPTQGCTHSISRRQEIIIREAIWVRRDLGRRPEAGSG